MLLLEASSQHNKGLQPVAFLVHAAHKARGASDDSERFAQIAEQVEVTLLEVCDAVDDESLEHIAKALGEGVERAELLGTFRGVSGLADFASICLRIKMGFGRLANPTKAAKNEISALVDLIEARRWHSDAPVTAPDAPSEPSAQLAAIAAARQEAVRTSRRQSKDMCGAPPDELALLRERNRLLAEQVAQMQRMLTAGNMLQRSMVRLVGGTAGIGHEEFMQRFPLPPNEAERRLALRASGVMAIGVHKGCVGRERVAELVTRMAQSEALAPDVLGSELVGVLVTLMDADTQRLLVALAKDETSGGFTAADLRRPLALPRKCTKCQHVIASGDVVCVKGGMKGGGGTTSASEVASSASVQKLIPSLIVADDAVNEATSLGKSLTEYVRAQTVGHPDPNWKRLLRTFSDRNLYTGAPIFLHGHVVGALCAYTAGKRGEGPPAVADERLVKVLREHAKLLERIFERFVNDERDR